MVMGSSRESKRFNKVTGKNTSASNRNLMQFGYVESRKPNRDKRIWVIGIAEAVINIYDVARHFGIHKTTAYRIINRFWQTGLAGDRPKSVRPKKAKSTGGTFHSYHINAGEKSFFIFQLLGECHCWWTRESPRAHVGKFYGRLRLIRSILRASKFSELKLIEIVILWVYYTIPYGLSLFRHFLDITFLLF